MQCIVMIKCFLIFTLNSEFMKNQVLLFLLFITLFSCNGEPTNEENEKNIEAEVLSNYKRMFDAYAEGSDKFFDYYEDEFVRVTAKGGLKVGVDQPKKDFNEFLKSNSIKVIRVDEPKIIPGQGQVVVIGGYEEYFVNHNTSDTTYSKGVIIEAWRKQKDDTWKISVETWHAGLE